MKMSFHLSFFILKSLLLLTLCTLGYTEGCVERERLALLDFKKSFTSISINYGALSSWESGGEKAGDCCTWEGITCDHTLHVTSLQLSSQGLESHQLLPSLLELQYLSILDLSFNNLDMRIPNFIGSLSKLTFLGIMDAGFFGMIPPQLGNLSNIQTLYLGSSIQTSSSNLYTDNFQWLSHLSSLQILGMYSINFSDARDWLSVIRELPSLSSFTCNWSYFPTPNLPSHVTHHVNSSSSLHALDISSSYLSPSTLSLLMNSTSVESLDLSENNLEVGIFHSIGNHCSLGELEASGCIIKERLTDILQALSGCASSSLESINFQSTNLTGTIPPLLKFHSLTYLDLSYNFLDNIPPVNAQVPNNSSSTLPLFPASLTFLHLDNNHLNGILSDVHFTTLSHIEELSLAKNPNLRVHYNKPLIRASYVDLSSCNLGPEFPRGLLAQNRIVHLDISHSNISSTIPMLFWRNLSPYLTYLDLSHNSLHGTVPNIHIHFHFHLKIDVSSNSLCGLIPFFLFRATDLNLSRNKFHGFTLTVPHPYHLSTNTYSPDEPPNIVDLSNNLLSGLIPQWLGFRMPNLGALILTNNNLSGTIPSSIGYSAHLYVLSLRNNNFSGPLPSLLKTCPSLTLLDLGGNRFSGSIPSWMGENMQNLILFSLGSNNLSGILPMSLCHISSLHILDLSNNMLSGNIPECFHDLKAMAHNVNSSSIEEVLFVEDDVTSVESVDEASYFNAYIKWKNRVWQFQRTLRLVKLIDLSSNNLSGEIPKGLTSLVELDSLDLSCNNLQGSIPEEIGQLESLQVLNLSYNRLNGRIPPSLSEIYSLEMLGLSHNNLSGRIPSGTQLGSFDPSAYSGNPYLCGMPLSKCPGDRDDSVQQPLQPSSLHDSEMEDKWTDEESFLAGLGTGFAFGFLGILASLTWITKWRYAFFFFATQFGEWILLVAALKYFSKFSRKL